MERFNLKHFNSEEEACRFLNDLDKQAKSSDNYSGKHFNFRIISLYREKGQVILIYEIIKVPFHL